MSLGSEATSDGSIRCPGAGKPGVEAAVDTTIQPDESFEGR